MYAIMSIEFKYVLQIKQINKQFGNLKINQNKLLSLRFVYFKPFAS